MSGSFFSADAERVALQRVNDVRDVVLDRAEKEILAAFTAGGWLGLIVYCLGRIRIEIASGDAMEGDVARRDLFRLLHAAGAALSRQNGAGGEVRVVQRDFFRVVRFLGSALSASGSGGSDAGP